LIAVPRIYKTKKLYTPAHTIKQFTIYNAYNSRKRTVYLHNNALIYIHITRLHALKAIVSSVRSVKKYLLGEYCFNRLQMGAKKDVHSPVCWPLYSFFLVIQVTTWPYVYLYYIFMYTIGSIQIKHYNLIIDGLLSLLYKVKYSQAIVFNKCPTF